MSTPSWSPTHASLRTDLKDPLAMPPWTSRSLRARRLCRTLSPLVDTAWPATQSTLPHGGRLYISKWTWWTGTLRWDGPLPPESRPQASTLFTRTTCTSTQGTAAYYSHFWRTSPPCGRFFQQPGFGWFPHSPIPMYMYWCLWNASYVKACGGWWRIDMLRISENYYTKYYTYLYDSKPIRVSNAKTLRK
jgi:hypothetical protein